MLDILLEEDISDMCNLSSGIREEGKLEATLNNIHNLMHTQNWSAEKAMSALGFDASEYPKYLALLQN